MHVAEAVVVVVADGVLANDAVGNPGSDIDAVEGQRQGEGEDIDVVKEIGLGDGGAAEGFAVRCGVVVVVVGAGPDEGQANVFVELVAGGDAGAVVVEDGRAAGKVGQNNALNAHADLKVGFRGHPVDVGALQFDDPAVGAEGAALIGLAPGGVADFKVHRAGEGFGSHGVQLQADALAGGEGVVVGKLLPAATGDEAALGEAEAHEPLAIGLEIYSRRFAGAADGEAGSQSESHKLLHDIFPLERRSYS